MRVAVVGSGGREHALAHVLGRTPGVEVVVTPGNAGIPGSTPTPVEELDADLVVVGPEAPLVDGLADRLRDNGVLVFGPGADGARLEGSKAFMKAFVAEAGVPTARYRSFTAGQEDEALAFLRTMPPPWVVKTDGLAAGKGVLVTESLGEAEDDVRAKLSGASFGAAGTTVVIEEGMVGAELSVLAVCDGTRAVALAPAQDFKRIGDGDTGANTGGMGSYSPVPFVSEDLVADVLERFIHPTLAALSARGIDYRGTLYAGLMLTDGGPRLVEYNVRFGDPETQVVLPRLSSDLTALLAAAAAGDLRDGPAPTFVDDAAVCVVIAAPGYPSSPRTGDVISGLEDARSVEGVTVFCAGVGQGEEPGRLVTAGGRVLNVVGTGPTIAEARRRAYTAAEKIHWPGAYYRHDIAEEAARA